MANKRTLREKVDFLLESAARTPGSILIAARDIDTTNWTMGFDIEAELCESPTCPCQNTYEENGAYIETFDLFSLSELEDCGRYYITWEEDEDD